MAVPGLVEAQHPHLGVLGVGGQQRLHLPRHNGHPASHAALKLRNTLTMTSSLLFIVHCTKYSSQMVWYQILLETSGLKKIDKEIILSIGIGFY